MIGVKSHGACNAFCDNDSVVKSATRPESTLQKKSTSIAYHLTREAQARGVVRIAKEDGETNLSDMFTKEEKDATHFLNTRNALMSKLDTSEIKLCKVSLKHIMHNMDKMSTSHLVSTLSPRGVAYV